MPSNGDKKCFKLMVNREEENKSEKEQRFYVDSVCSRGTWVKKLLQAKNGSYETNDCTNVPLEEMVALQRDLDVGNQPSELMSE